MVTLFIFELEVGMGGKRVFPEERSQKSPCLSLAPWKNAEPLLGHAQFSLAVFLSCVNFINRVL